MPGQLAQHLHSSYRLIKAIHTDSGTWGNFGETRGGLGKSGVLEHKSGNVSETRKDRKSFYGEPIGTHQRSFGRCRSRRPILPEIFGLPLLSQERGKSTDFQIWPVHSQGPSEQKPIENVGKSIAVGVDRDSRKFSVMHTVCKGASRGHLCDTDPNKFINKNREIQLAYIKS